MIYELSQLQRMTAAAYDRWTLEPLPDPPPLQAVTSTIYGSIDLRWWITRDSQGIDALALSTHSKQTQKLFLLIGFEGTVKRGEFHEIAGGCVREAKGRDWRDCKQYPLGDLFKAMVLTTESLAAIYEAAIAAVQRFTLAKAAEPAEIPKDDPRVRHFLDFITKELNRAGYAKGE